MCASAIEDGDRIPHHTNEYCQDCDESAPTLSFAGLCCAIGFALGIVGLICLALQMLKGGPL